MKTKKIPVRYMLAAAAFVGITVTAILFSCDVYRIVPLYVSLVVMILQTRANRACFLLGGLNAAYYAVVYVTLKLYGMALYSICVACPLQIITYIRWCRQPYAQATVLRRLTLKQRIGWGAGMAALWAALYLILDAFGSGYLILDNTISVISAAGNVGSMLSLIEFPFMQILAQVLNITLYVKMVAEDPRQWTYLIYSVYALACCGMSACYMQGLYRRQRMEHRRDCKREG